MSLIRQAVVLAVVLFSPVRALAQEGPTADHWVSTWMTAQVAFITPDASQPSRQGSAFAPALTVSDQTLRQTIRVSAGGSTVRVAFANTFGVVPVDVGAAHVALRAQGGESAAIVAPGVPLTFDGSRSAMIEVGSVLVSDPVDLTVPPLGELVVDLYLPGDTSVPGTISSGHGLAWTTNYVSQRGNHTGLTELPIDSSTQSWLYLSRVDVIAPADTRAVVTFGDSITEGFGSTPDANARWPDLLAQRLAESYGEGAPAVLNAGISGNRVLGHNGLDLLSGGVEPTGELANAGFGPSALSRFDRDVLLLPGVTHVIVLESINDIGLAGGTGEPSADQIIAGHRALIQRARARGLAIYGGTLTPFEGAAYWSDTGEATRAAVNDWIRSSGAYDAVIDFDATVRDASSSNRFASTYHAGDWLHPNDDGYRRMAEAIDLSLFRPVAAAAALAAAVSDGPRTSWGAPDLSGVWDFRTLTPLERPRSLAGQTFLSDEEAAAFVQAAVERRDADRRGERGSVGDVEQAYNDFWWDWGTTISEDKRTSLIVDPVDGRIPPLTSAAQAQEDAHRRGGRRPIRRRLNIGSPAHGPEDLGLSERCVLGFNSGPPILPSAYNNNVQLFQTPDYVVLLTEMIHEARIVPLDGRPHLDERIDQWTGDARGRWDGETLVVDSVNFIDRIGSFNTLTTSTGSGDTLHLTERLTRLGSDQLLYEFTIDDPATFTRPFTGAVPMRRSDGPLFEYACHEGNRGMANLLAGARALEKASATGGGRP